MKKKRKAVGAANEPKYVMARECDIATAKPVTPVSKF